MISDNKENFRIGHVNAGPLWDIVPKRGKGSLRFQLLTGGEEDHRFSFAVTLIKHVNQLSWTDRFNIKIGRVVLLENAQTTGGESILINVNSLATRLLLNKDQVHKIAKKGFVGLNQLRDQARKIQLIRDRISLRQENEDENNSSFWGRRKWASAITDIKNTKAEEATFIKTDQLGYLIIKDAEGLIEDVRHSTAEELGRGVGGVVYDSLEGNENEERWVLKKTIEGDARAVLQLANEKEILDHLHTDEKPVIGLQDKLYKFFRLFSNKAKKAAGYLVRRYESDYFAYVSKAKKSAVSGNEENPNGMGDRIFEFYQLLSGLTFMHARGVLHGDIKPANILTRKDQNGTQLFHISDFGGAAKGIKDRITNRHFKDVYTPQLHSSDDQTKRTWCKNDTNEIYSDKEYDEFEKLEKARDVFSMGAVFFLILTGGLPYSILSGSEGENGRNFSNCDLPNQGAWDKVPLALKDFLNRMLHKDSEERISAEVALRELNQIIEKYPEIKDKISQLNQPNPSM